MRATTGPPPDSALKVEIKAPGQQLAKYPDSSLLHSQPAQSPILVTCRTRQRHGVKGATRRRASKPGTSGAGEPAKHRLYIPPLLPPSIF
ncbi:hypothetical protein AVEN_272668-1 [Araneus ventricosus]|uniref:Uncharacterized protein n=1 Tax=Araneus ventricosus TaxID=182803 RepID=A0A4Y2NNX2_ARAVE|nr:hypothetical protein AVEN_272668-1 [Araneus ventricosus]